MWGMFALQQHKKTWHCTIKMKRQEINKKVEKIHVEFTNEP